MLHRISWTTVLVSVLLFGGRIQCNWAWMMLPNHETRTPWSTQSTQIWYNPWKEWKDVRRLVHPRSFSSVSMSSSPRSGYSATKRQDESNQHPYDDSSNNKDSNNWWEFDDLEVLQGLGKDFQDDDNDNGDDEEWIPDREMARRKHRPRVAHPTPASQAMSRQTINDKWKSSANNGQGATATTATKSPYTEEEEELIHAMGGKTKKVTGNTEEGTTTTSSPSPSKREAGFLGDCTLQEIAMDYSIPICYLADVLCMWGVPVPINVQDRLGDLVTGEQAFAVAEAVYSMDVGALQDRYSNQNLLQVCYEWDVDLKDAFEFAMKEGWSLPFGVQTHLRVEQEEELLRVLASY